MPSTSRATSAFAANALLLLTMASWGASQYTKVYSGCYSSSQPLKNQGTWTYQSSDYCQTECEKGNLPVLGLSDGDLCWCGSELPAANTKVSDSKCNTPCQGWPNESCGGSTDFFSVWLTGEESSVPSFGGGDSSSSSSSTTSSTTTSATPTVVTNTSPGKTVVVTQPASATASNAAPTNSSGSGSSNVAGIAAGVVVGVAAFASIVGGLFFFLRHKRRKAADEEYARTNQVSDFMRGGERKPPPTGYSSTSDSRLDPQAGKRNSVGSLADAQDYSRRILRVANPDGS